MIDKKKLYSTAAKKETAVLVAVSTQKQNAIEKTKEYLEELAFLATTLGVETVKTFTQNLERADIRTYTGKGKLEEIMIYVTANPVDMIIYDDDLSPSQVRNLEAVFKDIKVIDRSLLILDDFRHACANCAVEIAGRTGSVPIYVPKTDATLDALKPPVGRRRGYAWPLVKRSSKRIDGL
jgi:hypothetical protein